MKHLLLILISVQYSFGQNTEALFYNLPINSNKKTVENILRNDTSRFEVKEFEASVYGRDLTLSRFYLKTNFDKYSPKPEDIYIVIKKWSSNPDSIPINTIGLTLYYSKPDNRNKVKDLYYTLIKTIKGEYNFSKTKRTRAYVHGEDKNWKAYSTTSYFYKKRGDKNEKLSIEWCDERNHSQTIYINYTFDN
jgi:hypothetical protein